MLKIIRRRVLVKFIVIFLLFIPAPLILAGEMLYSTFVDTLISNNTNKNLQLTELIAKKIDENVLRYMYYSFQYHFREQCHGYLAWHHRKH